MTWRRVRWLTGLAALLLALALGVDVLGGRLGGPEGLRSLAAAALAFAGVAVFGVGTFTPIAAWVLLPAYERLLGADDARLRVVRFFSPSRREKGGG